jgi:hypothetical protein
MIVRFRTRAFGRRQRPADMDWAESEIDAWPFTDAARALARREIAVSRVALAQEPVR